MCTRTLLALSTVKTLLCLASMSLGALAYADGGTIRFSGRVVESGCATSLSRGQLTLSACPPSAQGSAVRMVALDDGQAVKLRDGKRRGQQLAVIQSGMQAGQAMFSQAYRVELPLRPLAHLEAYIAVVDYL